MEFKLINFFSEYLERTTFILKLIVFGEIESDAVVS